MQTKILNTSYILVSGTYEELEPITKALQVERPNAYHDTMVKRGLKAPYDCFYEVFKEGLLIPIGLGHFLGELGVQMPTVQPEYNLKDVQEYLATLNLPFVPYRHQVQAFYESLQKKNGINLMCTGCLDENTMIDVQCEDYTDDELRNILRA